MKKKRIVTSVIIIVIFALVSGYVGLNKIRSAKADDVAAPQDLTVPTLAYDDSSITLVWHKPDNYSNIKNYNIYMNGTLIGNAKDNNNSKAKTFIDNFYKDSSNASAVNISMHNYVVTGLKPDTSYNFTVRAVDSNGRESQDSNKVVQNTTKTPDVFDVTKYGAIGDGQTLDTKAIQKAIDACTPGGKVLIPAGKTFMSGSLWLKGEMIFEVDGKLLGSENPEDYINNDNNAKNNALINAIGNNSKNLKIVGSGVIDGDGWKQGEPQASTNFPNSLKSSLQTVEQNGILAANQYKAAKGKGFDDTKAYATRSNLISISNINNVYYGDGLSFVNPSQHVIGSSGCNNVILNGALIETFDCNNADGIDFDSKGLTVLNSVFDTGDDDVNFTAGKGADAEKNRKPVTDVWIFDNYFGRGHGAVVAGSNTAAWIENILAEDNVLNGTGSGLRCKTAPETGGGAKDITFRDSALKNITDGEGEPFIFTSNYSNSLATDTSFKPALHLPQFKHIFVTNCSVDGSKSNGIFVAGLKDACHTDIHFENVSFKNTQSAKIDYMTNSTFKNVTFDSSLKEPWLVTNSEGLSFEK
ncbi:glycoside hydrolase family 28 protein [Clostridium sp.]|uniref:glycoside hydrolase family 28 protein n=1 Tax=Clostridium sp. TaxID=1506 RepID=UPI0028502354|nr:glycoside hydrolase family 28 protein [Clostridium sp.]MDR3596010.1 glycoside hydrolase family 28 protein [Clostridium sp.]